jgi:sugar lactone lactonase YvrE
LDIKHEIVAGFFSLGFKTMKLADKATFLAAAHESKGGMNPSAEHKRIGAHVRIIAIFVIGALFAVSVLALAAPNLWMSGSSDSSVPGATSEGGEDVGPQIFTSPDDVLKAYAPGMARVFVAPTALWMQAPDVFVGPVHRSLGPRASNAAPGSIRSVAGSTGIGPALNLGLLVLGIAVHDGGIYESDLHWNAVRRLDLASGVQTLIAGTGAIDAGHAGDGGPANVAELYIPYDLTFDTAGNIYIADTSNHRVRKIDSNGIISTIAGNGQFGYGGDGGPAALALLWNPVGVAVDSVGNVYITDQGNNRIRKVDTNGIITTVAGGGVQVMDDVPGILSSLALPVGIAVDSNDNLFIADQLNSRIRKVGADGIITTVAGIGTLGFSGDGGPASQAQLGYPSDVAFDQTGNLFIADSSNQRVRRVDHQSGIIITVAGNGTQGYSGDGGPATAAEFYRPGAIALDAAGNLYITDFGNQRIRKVDTAGIVSTLAGNGTSSVGGDGGPATDAQMNFGPYDVALDSSANIYIVDNFNNRIRKVDSAGVITTVVGTGKGYFYEPPIDPTGDPPFSGDGGLAMLAHISYPTSVAFDHAGNLFISDLGNRRIRKVDTDGIIRTIAGTGVIGYNGDGIPAITAQLRTPVGLAIDAAGNLYVADLASQRVRKIDINGIITTFAGDGYIDPTTGQCRYGGDGGPAAVASLCNPTDLAFDSSGNLYIADQSNNRVRKVDAVTGIISTYAGNGINNGLLPIGDGGPATDAQINGPTGLAFDSAGNLFVSTSLRVRKIDNSPQHIITTVAGDGTLGFTGDGGPATSAKLVQPLGLADDRSGNLLIADWTARRLRRVDGIAATPVPLVSVGSRKTHGGAGAFDVDLPLTGTAGVECRSGGADGDYTLVFIFANALTSVGGASVSSGSGSVNDSGIGTDPHEYIVNLTGVTNTQVIIVSLTNVSDAAGNSSAGGISASMAMLLGDVNGNGTVSNTDVAAVKDQVAASVTASNFRNDVNANGIISNTDVSLTKTQVGTQLP